MCGWGGMHICISQGSPGKETDPIGVCVCARVWRDKSLNNWFT